MPTDLEPIERDAYDGDVVAFAVVPANSVIDWSNGRVPEETLWIPEEVISALIAAAPVSGLLHCLSIYEQTRFGRISSECLFRDLNLVEPQTDDERLAVAAIARVVRDHLEKPHTHLLIEGP